MWVKICGITSVDDAVMMAAAGADAIGLNFYPKSKRFVGVGFPRPADGQNPECQPSPLAHAKGIRDAVRGQLEVVGVFVNSAVGDVASTAVEVGLTAVQFHGDETPEQIAEFHQQCADVDIIRAFRIGRDGTDLMDGHLRELEERNVPLSAVLVDALVEGEYGGTGHTVNTDIIVPWMDGPGQSHRLVLAGGLKPDNVAKAAEAVRPWGIDTASGVELSPGFKSPEKVKQFVRGVRSVSTSADHRLRGS